MSVLYHMTSPAPRFLGTDAVDQDVAALQERFGGTRVRLNPIRARGPLWRLESLAGLQVLPALLRLDREVQLHHVFAGTLKHFPVLRVLKRPVVFTAAAGMHGVGAPSAALRNVARAIVVSSRRNADVVEGWGFANVQVIPPGIDVSRFSNQPIPLKSQLILLAGSAPWVKSQFATKGFDALFAVAARRPELRLVLLWRGMLESELANRIERFGLRDRVEVIRHKTDVNAVLGRVHATVVVAEHAHLIKEYPHSLLESLVAGKPVIVSESIAMADYVRNKQCGVVIPTITAPAVEAGLDRLCNGYADYVRGAVDGGRTDFSLEQMLEGYRQVYAACGFTRTNGSR